MSSSPPAADTSPKTAKPNRAPRRHRLRPTKEQRAEQAKTAVTRYEQGESVRAIAAALNCSYGTAHRMLQMEGVKMRKRGGRGRPPASARSGRSPVSTATPDEPVRAGGRVAQGAGRG
ncbi:helix-turn-helix domain-containing protein [Actinoplanes aureus]|uniref:helix-turn-helix domain-containing protein n=1 Tax=Actinoplanes aureus TaxID=2792083 RepID=UPI0035A046AA